MASRLRRRIGTYFSAAGAAAGTTGGGAVGSSFAAATLRVLDDFENNTLNAPPPAYASTFSWSGAPSEITIQAGFAKSGTRSKRFRFLSTTDTAEQRFSFSVCSQLWASWWFRVPDNYSHGSSGGDNNKLFMFWMDGYSTSGDGSTCGMEMRSDGGGSSYWYVKVSPGGNTVLGPDQGGSRFITVPTDRGRWMHVIYNVIPETSSGASDGRVRVWRKWDGDSSYTAVYDFTGQPVHLPASGPAGFANGYMMGWTNGRYAATTDFYVDDFTVGDTNIYGV